MSMLDGLLGLMKVLFDGDEVAPSRRVLNFFGTGVTVTDNPSEERIDIDISGGGGSGVTEEYVDDGDAATLVAANAYTDAELAAFSVGGDVVGPASSVTDRVAAFDGITGKLLKDGGKTIATILSDALAAAITAIGTRSVVAAYQGHSDTNVTAAATTSWTDISSTCTLVDDITSSITRSGSAFTFAKAGTYRAAIFVNFTQGGSANAGIRLRDTVANVTKLLQTPYTVQPALWLYGLFTVTAGQTLNLQTVRTSGGALFGIATIDGEGSRNVLVSFDWVGT